MDALVRVDSRETPERAECGGRPGRHRALGVAVLAAVVLALLWTTGPLAQLGPRLVGPLGPRDELKSDNQREVVDALARRHLGTRARGRELSELDTLQRLLDGRFVRLDDEYTQQCIGVVLGDLMAANLGLEWVAVDDDYGHSRALRYPGTEELFFPITMIPKRVKAREKVDIRALYELVAARVSVLDARS